MTKRRITLVIVSTETYELGYQAVVSSVSKFHFDEVLILSDDDRAWGDFAVTKINKFKSGREYNKFVLADLYKYVTTDYFVIIQYDGFVLNGDQFSPHFYHYDYIGAPWTIHPYLTVGNGGFSWRSLRLAEAGAKVFEADALGKDSPVVEDVYLCRTNRILLEDKFGMHFASEGVAAHFSLEMGTRHYPTFGFHGTWHLPRIYEDRLDWLLEKLPQRLLENDAIYALLRDEMYNLSAPHYKKLTKLRGKANRGNGFPRWWANR